jgi:iron complex outermembrane receptor protein
MMNRICGCIFVEKHWINTPLLMIHQKKYKEGLMLFERKAALLVVFAMIAGHTFFPVSGLSAEEIKSKTHPDVSSAESFELESVIVTAEKREKNVQEIPGSVSVVSETQIADFNVETTKDVVSMTPNLYITDTGNGLMSTFASIRGITGGMTGIPSLGLYVDDVYYPGLDIGLLDVERVEILRGPQGTLYGRNSEAGIINVITKKPTDTWESSLSLDAGKFDSREVRAMVSGPVMRKQASFRAAFRYFETDNYFENRFDGSDEAGRAENIDARLSLGFTPTDRLNLTLGYDFQQYDSPELAIFAPLDQGGDLRKNINVDYQGKSSKDAHGGHLRAAYKMEEMQLVSITSARNEDYLMSNDADLTPVDMMTLTLAKDITTVSQELRLVSDKKDAPLQWLCGVFFLSEQDDRKYDTWMNFMNMGMGVPGETLTQKSGTHTWGGAVFGEMSYGFGNGINISLGLRYDYERKEFDYTQTPSGPGLPMVGYGADSGEGEESFDAWLPKAVVSYRGWEHLMPYASVSRGFRSGGFNDIDNLGSAYDAEFTWNYEVGVKTDWLDNRVRVNLAFFHIDWTDMQVEIPTAGGTAVYIDNAGEATSQGVELEVAARPLPGLEILAGGAYTDACYEDYTSGANVYDDKRIIDSPEYTLNLGATYRFDSGFFVNGKYAHFGQILFDPANTRSQKNYGLFDAKIGFETEHFDIYVYGKNLLDQDYVTRAFEVNDTLFGRAGAPRIFGIMLKGRI